MQNPRYLLSISYSLFSIIVYNRSSCSFLDSAGIDCFLDIHALDVIGYHIDSISRIDVVLALYNLMIVVFKEGWTIVLSLIPSISFSVAFVLY